MRRYCFALDLKDDPALIAEYDDHHRHVWPQIIQSIKDAGVLNLEVYRLTNRLFMIMEVTDDFSSERKARLDAVNPVVQEWETIMWRYQQALPSARSDEKWLLMEKIFQLDA